MTKEEKQIFWVWCDMRARCSKPNHKSFKNYGGRGIHVCDRWSVFTTFKQDMGSRTLGGMLDRINNNAGYEPSNCRWATRKEQNSNRRNCIFVEVDGQVVTLKEACRRLGLTYRPVHKRIMARGWSVARALSTPISEATR